MKTQNTKFKIMSKLSVVSYQLSVARAILIAFIAFNTMFLSSCKKDEEDNTGKYSKGVFVTNEGPFQTGTGTVSFINRDNNTIENDVFEAINNRPLGNIVQSATYHNGKIYVVVNNADKIEIVDADDFKEVGVINGLKLPRFILPVSSNKAYVSQWGTGGLQGEIKVIDLNSNTITKTIATGKGAEALLKKDNFVYVTNGGGLDNNNTVTVIDINTDAVVATLTVGDNPNSIQLGANGNLYVLCSGKWKSDFSALETKGALYVISSNTQAGVTGYNFNSDFSQPTDLVINPSGNKLYYNYDGAVYTQDISASVLQLNALVNRNFYSLGYDPTTNYLYAGDAGNFTSSGKVLRYNSTTGAVVDSFDAGIAPNGFLFK
jgi:YVTN family beta-propeller protein